MFLWAAVLAGVIAFTYMESSLAYLSYLKNFGNTNPVSIALGLAPVVVVFIIFLIVFYSRSSFFPFECIGNRVEVLAKKISPKIIISG